MTKTEWLEKHGFIMSVKEVVEWAKRNNLNAAAQRRAQDHFLACEECDLEVDYIDDKPSPSATPCGEYFKLIGAVNRSSAVWPDGRFALEEKQ